MADQNIKVNINLDLTEFNKNAKAMSDALSRVLGKDVKMFADEMNKAEASINGAERALGNAGRAATKTGNSVRQSNIQWNNLALVIQDLPFGFRGIQNNLPALAGSIAGIAGPAMVAFSALTAAVTAYDMGIFGAKKSTDDFTTSLKNANDELRKAVNSTTAEENNLESLIRVGLNYSNSETVRLNALKEIKKVLSGVNKEEADKISTIEEAIIPVKLYTEALRKQNLQEVTSKNLSELQNKVLEQKQKYELAKGIQKRSPGLLKTLFGYDDLPAMALEISQAETMIRSLEGTLDQVNKKQGINPFEKVNTVKPPKVEIDTNNLELLKQQQKYYKDDLYLFYKYGAEIIAEEERLAVKRAEIEGKTAAQIEIIRKNFALQKKINIQEEGRALMAIAEKNTKDYEKIEADIAKVILKNREDIANGIKKINSDLNNENIKNVNTELQQTLKATRGNYNAQKEAYQLAIDKLKEKKAALDATNVSTVEYTNAIKNLEAGMGGLVDPLEQLGQTLQSTFNQLNIDMLTAFGEQLGELMSGKEFDFTKLGTILADALSSIGKALIAYAVTNGAVAELFKNPGTWPAALVAGIAAVAAGSALKNKLSDKKATAFANGGIVSGPTMGLVGEYPGAQNNPEVIAPLDKLKSMIGGGGGGTFVLRGQDLLLATNRAQKASNLKGQNISLA